MRTVELSELTVRALLRLAWRGTWGPDDREAVREAQVALAAAERARAEATVALAAEVAPRLDARGRPDLGDALRGSGERARRALDEPDA